MIVGGDQSWPVVAQVIEVGAVENMRKALGSGDSRQLGIQRCFAVKTPVGRVCSIIGLAEFVRDDDLVGNAPVITELFRQGQVRAF